MGTQRNLVTSALDVVGLGCLGIGAFQLADFVGWLVVGASVLAVSASVSRTRR